MRRARLDELDGDVDLEEDDPPGGNVEDGSELVSDYEDHGTHSYITPHQMREVKRIKRELRTLKKLRSN